jgi:hypothetical protein
MASPVDLSRDISVIDPDIRADSGPSRRDQGVNLWLWSFALCTKGAVMSAPKIVNRLSVKYQ